MKPWKTKQRLSGLAWIIFVALFCFSFGTNAADHICTNCHSSATPSASDLLKPLSGLCADCHSKRIAEGEHAVDVPVTAPSNTLPLRGIEMTCITCHDPHQPLAALRMQEPELCEQCHRR